MGDEKHHQSHKIYTEPINTHFQLTSNILSLTPTMMFRSIIVVALLLTVVVGSDAELLRGTRRDHPRKQIRKLMMSKSTKVGDEDIRDDTNIVEPPQPLPPDPVPPQVQPPATPSPPPATQAPPSGAISPSTSTCLCPTLCQQCQSLGLGGTASCNSLCMYAHQPSCEDCNAYLQGFDQGSNRDDTGVADDTCVCVYACDQCNAHGSHTADCKTVCEYAQLSNADCTTLCNKALHIGEP